VLFAAGSGYFQRHCRRCVPLLPSQHRRLQHRFVPCAGSQGVARCEAERIAVNLILAQHRRRISGLLIHHVNRQKLRLGFCAQLGELFFRQAACLEGHRVAGLIADDVERRLSGENALGEGQRASNGKNGWSWHC